MSTIGDDLYLVTHDDRTGNPRVPGSRVRLGLAAGLIAELLVSGHLTIRHERLYLVPGRAGHGTPPSGPLSRTVLATVASQPPQGVGAWTRFLAQDAVEDIRDRLLRTGVLTTVRRPSLLTGWRVRYPPADGNVAAWPGIRLARTLSRSGELTVEDAVLTGLVAAMDLLHHVLRDEVDAELGRSRARAVRDGLPPVLAALLAHTESALADGVLTYRS
ncbi:MAG: hypothetical protein QG622_2926 [Actinomycetota bacterium]|nr:hypothetical protein [Actinomycetota bacterium]